MKRWALCAACLVFSATAFGVEPSLTQIEPRGAQRGKAVRLTLDGYGLTDEAKILTDLPGAVTKLAPKDARDRELSYLLELVPDALVGAYPVRVESPEGISNVLLFTVGPFPEVTEGESDEEAEKHSNDSRETAETVEHPATVNGTLGGPDQDVYRFIAKAGEKVVFEVEARRIGSGIDPVLEIRDNAGKLIARATDSPGIGVDARTEVTFPADGTYYVTIRDARFSDQRENFYRLKAGSYSYAEGLFPLGWRRGETVEVQLFGGNLPEPLTVKPDLSAAATRSGYALIHLPGDSAALPMPFFVSDDGEIMEPSGAPPHDLEPGVVVNGRVGQPGETDRYRLKVKPGESWMIETEAASLDTSALYGLITIFDGKGKKLASAGDVEPEEPLSFISSTGETFGDPHLAFTVPEGTSEITITIEDLLGRGGPGYGYRLVARPQPPDFTLTLLTPHVNIPQKGSALVAVQVARRGYMGAVRLEIPDLPDDLMLQGGHVPAEVGGMTTRRDSRRGVLTITPKPGAERRQLTLNVWGEGRLEGAEVVRRKAAAPGMMVPVRGTNQEPATAPWLGAGLPARVSEPEEAVLEVLTPLRVRLIQGMEHDIKWAFASRASGVRPIDRVAVQNNPAVGNLRVIGGAKNDEGARSGEFKLMTTMGTSPMTFDLYLTSKARIGGREVTINSPAISFEVVQGFQVDPPLQPVQISRGRTSEIVGRFHREPDFLSPVTLRADNLPLNVSCEPVEIAEDPAEYRLWCEAGRSAEPGEYEIELTAASTLAGRDRELVPYKIPAVATKLIVTASGRIAAAR